MLTSDLCHTVLVLAGFTVQANAHSRKASSYGIFESWIEADFGEVGATDSAAFEIPQLGRWLISVTSSPGRFRPLDAVRVTVHIPRGRS